MKIIKVSKITALIGMLCAVMYASFVWADEETDRLKQLERAMTAPSDTQSISQSPAKVNKTKNTTRNLGVIRSSKAEEIDETHGADAGLTQNNKVQVEAATVQVNANARQSETVAVQSQANAGKSQTQALTKRDCGTIATDAKLTAVEFPIQFNVGSADLTDSAENTLQLIAKILSLANNCVLVEGHTDSDGNFNRNMELSRQRADSVVQFLSKKVGVSRARLIALGKGSSEPIKNLDSRNPKNRRVVFKVVS